MVVNLPTIQVEKNKIVAMAERCDSLWLYERTQRSNKQCYTALNLTGHPDLWNCRLTH